MELQEVSLEHIESALMELGYLPIALENIIVITHSARCHSLIRVLDEASEIAVVSESPSSKSDPQSYSDAAPRKASYPRFEVSTTHRGQLDFAQVRELSEFVNDWNHDCLTPRVVLDYDNPSRVRVHALTIIESTHGLSPSQLNFALEQAVGNAGVLCEELEEKFPAIALRNDPGLTSSSFLDLEGHIFSELENSESSPVEEAAEVNLETVAHELRTMGIEKIHPFDDEGIYAWINDVLFGFIIDNGPSLIIKGHWDPELSAEDFMRVFLVCNDFNKRSDAPVAYCHSNVEGLQVRLDVTANTAAGLSRKQLRMFVGKSLHTILHGIDLISTEVCGQSPVSWPEV